MLESLVDEKVAWTMLRRLGIKHPEAAVIMTCAQPRPAAK